MSNIENEEIQSFHLPTINQKRSTDYERTNENELIKEIYKTKFFLEFDKHSFDLEMISNKEKDKDKEVEKKKNEEYHRFNLFIKEMFEKNRYYMQDIVTFLEEDLIDTKQVLSCLNEENYYELRHELSVKYNKKHNESKIDLIVG